MRAGYQGQPTWKKPARKRRNRRILALLLVSATVALTLPLLARPAARFLGLLPPFRACGIDSWPADTNNDDFSDMFDIVSLTNHYAQAVGPPPNPSVRYDIAPNVPDGFVDIFDISKMTSRFGQGCR